MADFEGLKQDDWIIVPEGMTLYSTSKEMNELDNWDIEDIKEIWWYTVEINQVEQFFSLKLDETNTIIVEFRDLDFRFRHNHEWILTEWEYWDVELSENEKLEWNDYVNNLNKVIKLYEWKPLKNKDLQQVVELFEAIKS